MAILDAYGRPIATQTLRQPQTQPMVRLRQSFAGHPVRGLTPERMAGLLTAAEDGDLAAQADLYEDMEERDPHLHAEMAKRRRAMLGLPWSIEPPPNPSGREKRQAKAVAAIIDGLYDVEDIMLDALDGIGHGFACLEITWARDGAGWLPDRAEHRPQRWFRLDRATRAELRLNDGSGEGAPLQPFGWIVHRHAARSGYLTRAGLYRVLSWPWIMRQFGLRDMAEWLEIYGLPMRIGKYPAGADRADRDVLARAVRDLGRNAGGIMPDDMQVELVAAAAGSDDPFMAMVQYCDQVISKAILGGTLSSTPGATGLGSGVANLQGEVRRDLLVSDARQLQGTLSRDLIWPITALNGLGDDPRRAPRLVFDTSEGADLKEFSEAIERLVKAGMGRHIPVEWVREHCGIPEPADGEATLEAPEPEPDQKPGQKAPPPAPVDEAKPDPKDADQAAASLAAGAGKPALSADEPDYADEHTAALAAAAAIPLEGWLGRIRAEVDLAIARGGSMADLAERLLRLYPELPSGEMTAVMGEALAAADLAGRYDIDNGN